MWVPASASAQFTEQIDRYDVSIEIGTDGSLLITETIDYDFGIAQTVTASTATYPRACGTTTRTTASTP